MDGSAMMTLAGFALASAACGRIGFDELSDGAPGEGPGLEAGPALVFAWEADDLTGWTYDNCTLDRVSSLDWCVCDTLTACGSCSTNSALQTGNGLGTFTSGGGGAQPHQQEGISARRPNISVPTGVALSLDVDIRAMSATIVGNIGTEMEPTRRPRWSFHIFDGATLVAEMIVYWATPQCMTCPTVPSDLGVKSLMFTSPSPTIELVVMGVHRSSQCASVVRDVRIDVDSIRIRRLF